MPDLPELKYLDEATQRAGCGSWGIVTATCAEKSALGRSIISNARTLQKLAELEAENAKHRLAERERIVAWLNEQSYDIRPFGLLQGDHPSSVLTEAADRIERGDHEGEGR